MKILISNDWTVMQAKHVLVFSVVNIKSELSLQRSMHSRQMKAIWKRKDEEIQNL